MEALINTSYFFISLFSKFCIINHSLIIKEKKKLQFCLTVLS